MVCATFAGKRTENEYTMTADMENRVRRAEELFVSGFNCAQAVTAAFADIYGYSEEQALRLSAGFGGGIGRTRQTCGAACGMVILAGMDCGSADAGDREGKSDNYRVVQQLLGRFKELYGTTVCAELLRLKRGTPLSYAAGERTAEYYRTRPCLNQVVAAARIFAEYIAAQASPYSASGNGSGSEIRPGHADQ